MNYETVPRDLKLKLSKTDQSIMVLLSNYERSSFYVLYLDRKEKWVIDAMKIVKQPYLQ